MKEDIRGLIKDMNSALSTRKGSADILEKKAMDIQINEISQRMLELIDGLGEGIKEHYNTVVYDVDNGSAGVKQYDERSILREIIQNIVDCDYKDAIEIAISFNDNKREIVFDYNESGFKLSDLISFFSLEHTGKTQEHTGAFGIGAKGALLNADYMEVQSICKEGACLKTNFTIRTKEQSKKRTLEIEKLAIKVCSEEEKCGTKLKISLKEELYRSMKENLLTLTGKAKGKYITPLDFVFASIKKADKKINFRIGTNIIEVEFAGENNQVKFTCNGVGAEFIVYSGEVSKYNYVFFKSRVNCEDKPAYIDHKYNYFSTYELIGSAEDIEKNGVKFWINIPTMDEEGEAIITYDRTGIEPKQYSKVESNIKNDCIRMLKEFGERKVLWFMKEDDAPEGRCTYMLEQLYNIADVKFSVLKKYILEAVYWSIKDEYIKVNDMVFAEETEENRKLIKNITEKDFVLYEKYSGMKRGYSHSKRNELKYKFCLYRGGKCESFFEQEKEWERESQREPKLGMIIDILNQAPGCDSQSMYFMSVQADGVFSEVTLINLLKALKAAYKKFETVSLEFSIEDKCITVADKKYQIDFEINRFETVKESVELRNLKRENEETNKLFEFIRSSYCKYIHANKELSEILREYKGKKGINFEFAPDNTLLVQVGVCNGYMYGTYDTIDRLTVESMEYSELVNIIGITNYRLFLNNKLDENFRVLGGIEEYYGFNIDDIRYYTNRSDLILSNFHIGDTDYNLGKKDLVVQIKNNEMVYITDDFQYTDYKDIENSEFLFLPAKNSQEKTGKIKITQIAGFLDGIWGTRCIKNLYREIKTPITKINAQIPYTMKPLVDISKKEMDVIEGYLKYHMSVPEKRPKVFAMDISSKLFGYSAKCPLCGFESDSPSAFLLREDMEYYENGVKFQISLYLCANEWYESESWLIQEIRFMDKNRNYNISFQDWMKEIKTNEKIDKNRLKCKMRIVKKYSNTMFDIESQVVNNHPFERELVLTPAMAIQWYARNNKNQQ